MSDNEEVAIDVDLLRQTLKEQNVYIYENQKNLICKCIFCGDHPNIRKQGHLWVSKNIPVCRCFLCNKSVPTRVLIDLLCGNSELTNKIIPYSSYGSYQHKQDTSKKTYTNSISYKVPEIIPELYPAKNEYFKKRVDNTLNINNVQNKLIFDFKEFFKINKLDENKISDKLFFKNMDYMQDNFIGFLSDHSSTIYCRAITDDAKYKFRKCYLNVPTESEYLDYVSFKGNDDTQDNVVLSEGTFNILSAIGHDVFKNEKILTYAAGQSFSYDSLLESVMYDYGVYKPNVIILSDKDKLLYNYYKFYKKYKDIIRSIRIFYNKTGKDFGEYPLNPVEASLNKFEKIKTKRINKK